MINKEQEIKSNEYKEVDLNIGIDQKDPYDNLFQQQYFLQLHNNFIEKREEKKHNINSHSKRFKDKIKLNHEKEETIAINKRRICDVNFGMNIWTEINWVRPAIIYKHDEYKFWEDIIVIPITSYKDEENKSKDTFDVELEKNKENGLDKNSLAKIRQIKCISKKRLRKKKNTNNIVIRWKIENEEIKKQIDSKVRVMFWI